MFDRLLTNKMFTLSAAALLVAAMVVLLQLPGVAGAILAPNISDDETAELLQTSLKKHEEDAKLYRDRFVGRSIFFMPPAPPPPPPPPRAERGPVEPVIVEQPPPEIPVEYGGPDILALLADQVHIAGGKILKLGQEDPDTGLTVLEFVPPWSVKVRWHKKPGNYAPGNYVVEMFKSDEGALFAKGSEGESTPAGLSQASEPDGFPATGSRRSASPQRTED